MLWFSETSQVAHISAIALGEIAFGISRLKPDQRSRKLVEFLVQTQERFAGRVHAFDSAAALIYGEIMGRALRSGHNASIPDGMIAAIALRNHAAVATRNVQDFEALGVKVLNPWG